MQSTKAAMLMITIRVSSVVVRSVYVNFVAVSIDTVCLLKFHKPKWFIMNNTKDVEGLYHDLFIGEHRISDTINHDSFINSWNNSKSKDLDR